VVSSCSRGVGEKYMMGINNQASAKAWLESLSQAEKKLIKLCRLERPLRET